MARRSRRHRRRGARRLRRFRRSGRSFGRRRYSRSFRYSRRRSSRSRKRYRYGYHGRYKKSYAITTGYLPPGYMRRTYNFLFTETNILTSDGNFPPLVQDLTSFDANWVPSSFMRFPYSVLTGANNSFEHFWTSPYNIYSVENLPATLARMLGANRYTVIRLDWLGFVRCQFSGFFSEVSRQIRHDFEKYGYWRPGRITVKLIPKFGKPPSFQLAPASYSYTSSVPSYSVASADVPISSATLYQTHAVGPNTTVITGVTGGVAGENVWTTAADSSVNVGSHTAVLPQLAANPTSSTVSGTITAGAERIMVNRLALRYVGYLLPSGYDTVDNGGSSSAPAQMYRSIFSSVTQVPNEQWSSSFRSAGYRRQILSSRRSCKFSYKFSRYTEKAGVPYIGETQNRDGTYYVVDPLYTITRSWSTTSETPYLTIHDPARHTWLRGDFVPLGFWRIRNDTLVPENPARAPTTVFYPQYQPLDYCNVFIPGMDIIDLFRLYHVRFSYTCKFGSRVYDGE